ncbi:MAG: glycosyltransferase family 4 protein [Armatimonadetes bacterium]|nr:glycosyltransferase family 4 protein [Armatimonadota bacterium]
MRVGIDARTLSGPYTGDRTYWRGLLAGLGAVDRENEYVLYVRKPIEGEPPPGLGPNFRWRTLPTPEADTLWMLRGFPEALREDHIDIAHTQYNIPLLGSPCPVVTTVHDVTFALFPDLFLPRDRWVLNGLVPRSMRRAARVIADSECTRRDILRLYRPRIPPEKVTTILLAADSRFRPPPGGQESARRASNSRYDLGGRPYVLAVGVLQPRKNLALLLDAFALIKLGPTAPPHRLVIAGKRGWKNDELDRHLEALPDEVRQEIVFTGYVPDGDLPMLYGGADALCFPSRYEGFGLPPLEALACGCPVLCSRTSSLPEVVGDAGLLLPPDDSSAWANALDKLLSSETVRERWRERGPGRAALFSWEKTARETLRVYEEVVGDRTSVTRH